MIADGGCNDESVKWQCHDVVVFTTYLIVDPPEAVSCVKDSFVRDNHLWQHSSPSDLKIRLKTIARIFGSSSDAIA